MSEAQKTQHTPGALVEAAHKVSEFATFAACQVSIGDATYVAITYPNTEAMRLETYQGRKVVGRRIHAAVRAAIAKATGSAA